MSNALATVEQHAGGIALFEAHDPAEIMRRAALVAKPLAEHIGNRGLSRSFGGTKNHVYVEGWLMAGTMTGVYAEIGEVKPFVDDHGAGGYLAEVWAKTAGGQIIGHAQAICTRSEATWKSKPSYALYSMAQTRATSRALRAGLGWIMELAGFDPTPAEEAEGINFQTVEPGTPDAGGRAEDPSRLISKSDRASLNSLRLDLGLTALDVKGIVDLVCSVDDSTLIPRGQLDDVIAEMRRASQAHADLDAAEPVDGELFPAEHRDPS